MMKKDKKSVMRTVMLIMIGLFFNISVSAQIEIGKYDVFTMDTRSFNVKIENSEGYFRVERNGFFPGGTPQYLGYYSEDLIDWKMVMCEWAETTDNELDEFQKSFMREGLDDLSGCAPSFQMIKTEFGYLARSTYGDGGYVYTAPEVRVYLFDENFNLIKAPKVKYTEIESNGIPFIKTPLSTFGMSYVNGVCYLEIYAGIYGKQSLGYGTDMKIIKSTDFEKWELCPEIVFKNSLNEISVNIGEMGEYLIPYIQYDSTGKVSWYSNEVHFSYDKGEIHHGGKEVVYEEARINNIFVYNDYFFASLAFGEEEEQTFIAISKDGIYFRLVEVPELYNQRFSGIKETIDGKYALEFSQSPLGLSRLAVCMDILTLEDEVPINNPIVQLNNRILGFSTPPVMEDDRMLVPMRFLFEQMGAEVNWDENTQTATATVPVSADAQLRSFGAETAKSVTFAIDNTMATVNGSTAEMDVPARLVNDKTMVPLRFLSENLGCTVDWDEATNTAIITTNN